MDIESMLPTWFHTLFFFFVSFAWLPPRTGENRKEGNFVSIKVLGQAIESVGKGGLPDQIDLDALLKAVQRYKQKEGPKEQQPASGLNGVLPLPNLCTSASGMGQEGAPIKLKEAVEPSQVGCQLAPNWRGGARSRISPQV